MTHAELTQVLHGCVNDAVAQVAPQGAGAAPLAFPNIPPWLRVVITNVIKGILAGLASGGAATGAGTPAQP